MDRWKGSNCRVYECDGFASGDIDLLPICGEHAWELAQHFLEALTEKAQLETERRAKQAKETAERIRGNREDSVVYYARIGDYIKIGFTSRLRRRLSTLRVDELLAVEPGGPELERERHKDFAHWRIDLRRENFRPSSALMGHIEAMREEHGLPHWASLPRTSIITRRDGEPA